MAPDDHATWLVEIPLANVSLERDWAPAGARAAVRRAWDAEGEPGPQSDPWATSKEEARTELAVFQHLGDRLGPPTRFVQADGRTLDTRRTASLLLLQEGARPEAIAAARAKAGYALAVWFVLAPPPAGGMVPSVAAWAPQPALFEEPPCKRYEPNEWLTSEPRHAPEPRTPGPYPLPGDEVLEAPFTAFEALERRPARALLSCAAELHAAARCEETLRARRSLHAWRAIESLCGPAGDAIDGWARLVARLAQAGPSAGGDLRSVAERASRLARQPADAALIDLRSPDGEESVHEDVAALLAATAAALRSMWPELRAEGFDDGAFERLSAPS